MGIQQALLGGAGGGIVDPISVPNGGSIVAVRPSAAYIQLTTDGTLSTTQGTGAWFSPTTASIGTGYYVNVAVDSGDAMDTTPGTGWYELTSQRYFAYDGASAKSGSWTVSISSDSSGTPVVSTASLTVTLA